MSASLHGFMPGAIHEPIPAGDSDPPIDPCGVIQHIAVSNADDLHGQFSNDGGIESHFYIRKDGTILQYRSIFREADAQFDGNSFGSPRKGFISVEHQGGVGADLNVGMPKAQLDAFHEVVLWVHSQRPFLLRVTPGPFSEGVGYHAMFDEWNHNHHSCPGAGRIKQFNAVTVPWLAAQANPKPKLKQWQKRVKFLRGAAQRQKSKQITGWLRAWADRIEARHKAKP